MSDRASQCIREMAERERLKGEYPPPIPRVPVNPTEQG